MFLCFQGCSKCLLLLSSALAQAPPLLVFVTTRDKIFEKKGDDLLAVLLIQQKVYELVNHFGYLFTSVVVAESNVVDN
jgi:hypothetical protein